VTRSISNVINAKPTQRIVVFLEELNAQTLQPKLGYNHLSSIPLVFLIEKWPLPCPIVTPFVGSDFPRGILSLDVGGCLLSDFKLAFQTCKLGLGGSYMSA
jgi:hypothetical protein